MAIELISSYSESSILHAHFLSFVISCTFCKVPTRCPEEKFQIFTYEYFTLPQVSIFREFTPHFPSPAYKNLPNFKLHSIILKIFESTLLNVRLM
jgi:hypothetical protein